MTKKVVRYKLVRHKWPDEIKAERERRMKRAAIAAACVVFFFVGFTANEMLRRNHVSNDKTFAKLSEIYTIMSEQFYFGKDKENFKEALVNGAVEGMVNAGNDQHTMYLDTQQSSDFTSSMEGSFVGIGVQFYEEKDDVFTITRVMNDSPAEAVGIEKGDQIYKINDTVCEGMDSDEVKDLISGESGSKVKLELIRKGTHITKELERKSVSDSVYTEIQGDVAVLEISSFSETVGDDTGKQLEKIKKAGCSRLILDLRDNGGGYLNAAQQIASYLLPKDSVIFKEKTKDGKVEEFKTKEGIAQYSFDKILLLVNGSTASAAEVLTAALKENLDMVTIVGENTYGKGTVQYPLAFSDGSMLKYTMAEWITPKGNAINGVGIRPDVEIKLDAAYTTGAPKLEEKESYAPDSVNIAAKSVQTYLKFLGYPVDRSDEYFSVKSAEALKQYQREQGMKADGKITAEVIDRLLSSVSETWNADLERYDTQMKKAKELAK